jgi:ribosome-binding protein aMBF1 (putative translation factor)
MKKLRMPRAKKDLKWFTPDEVFGKVRKSKEFKDAYNEEMARLALAQAIRELRETRNFTQSAVAEKINMPQSVIARLESGRHSVSVDTLSKVAHALGKRVELV